MKYTLTLKSSFGWWRLVWYAATLKFLADPFPAMAYQVKWRRYRLKFCSPMPQNTSLLGSSSTLKTSFQSGTISGAVSLQSTIRQNLIVKNIFNKKIIQITVLRGNHSKIKVEVADLFYNKLIAVFLFIYK